MFFLYLLFFPTLRSSDLAIEIAVERKITHTPAVRSARGLFEFGDDLHRPNFGRPAERPGRKSRPHQIVRRLRSEEHTSELQSRQYLVCRLLLEKKKIKYS